MAERLPGQLTRCSIVLGSSLPQNCEEAMNIAALLRPARAKAVSAHFLRLK